MSLTNKVVLVTGGSSGIGAAIAIKFTQEGAKVAIVGRNEEKLKIISEKCDKVGSKPLVIVADVSKDDDVKRIVDDTLKHFNKLDVLINNAGRGSNTSILEENAMKVFDQVMAINLRSCVYLTHLASKHLLETKGNIINISSMAALTIYNKSCFSYCTSKAAMDHFTRAVAAELAPKGVRVNTINPGPVRTDFMSYREISEEEEAAAWGMVKKHMPLQRVSEPEEIADLALFMASDKGVAITGASFLIDNGALVKTDY